MTPTTRLHDHGTWRLLSPVALDAAPLLGRLQAVLESVGAGVAPPTVCFERWQSPALILGAGQPAADVDLTACQTRGIPVVRLCWPFTPSGLIFWQSLRKSARVLLWME